MYGHENSHALALEEPECYIVTVRGHHLTTCHAACDATSALCERASMHAWVACAQHTMRRSASVVYLCGAWHPRFHGIMYRMQKPCLPWT
eukprot:182705-Chlamydomonas_euryale.AAC.14